MDRGDMNKISIPITNVEDIKTYFKNVVNKNVHLFEFGVHSSRFDMIRVDTWNQKIKGFEFKVSKQDFRNDKKWPNYLKYCHSLTFVCPEGLITKKELPKHIGILYIKKWRWPHNDRWFYEPTWARKPRNQILDKDTYIEVISLLLNRTKWRWGDFF